MQMGSYKRLKLGCTVVDKKNAPLVIIPTHIIVEK